MPLTAVILAGGRGSRLGQLTEQKPKPLMEVAGRSLLSYGIAWAKALGAEKIIVAGSHQSELVRQAALEIDPSIVFVKDEVEKPGNRILGLLAAADEIVGDAVVYDGDYIFHDDIANQLRNTSYKDVTVHASKERSPYTAQDVIISYDDMHGMQRLWKTAGTVPLEGENQAYFNSLLFIPESVRGEFLETARQTFSEKPEPVHVEDAVTAYAGAGKRVHTAFFDEPLWMEVDTPEELGQAELFVNLYKRGIS